MSAEHITDEQLCWEYIKYEENFQFVFQNKTRQKKNNKQTRAEICDFRK